MAPPFNRFFVDIQGVTNQLNAPAWGVYVEATENPEAQPYPGDDGVPRWILVLRTFIETGSWAAAGPACTHLVGLAEDGTWFPSCRRPAVLRRGHRRYGAGIPPEVARRQAEGMLPLVLPVLLAISLMHCRNVDIRTVEPEESASRANRRRRGHRLVRYQVLEIEPMRRLLNKAGATDASAGGLRRALTICRGHFETFTPDAPLFGRHVGQYWWAPHVRGNPDAGIVINDCRVHSPGIVGDPYRRASETAHDERLPPVGGDPDSCGRGWVEHNQTQNELARIVATQPPAIPAPRQVPDLAGAPVINFRWSAWAPVIRPGWSGGWVSPARCPRIP